MADVESTRDTRKSHDRQPFPLPTFLARFLLCYYHGVLYSFLPIQRTASRGPFSLAWMAVAHSFLLVLERESASALMGFVN